MNPSHPSPDPEQAMQERTGPIFDLFMFLFVMAFIALIGLKVIARKIIRAFLCSGSISSPPKDFLSHGSE